MLNPTIRAYTRIRERTESGEIVNRSTDSLKIFFFLSFFFSSCSRKMHDTKINARISIVCVYAFSYHSLVHSIRSFAPLFSTTLSRAFTPSTKCISSNFFLSFFLCFFFFFSYKISQKSHQPLFATKQPKYRVMLPEERRRQHIEKKRPLSIFCCSSRDHAYPPPPYSPSTLLASSFSNDRSPNNIDKSRATSRKR